MSGNYRFKREHALPRAEALVEALRPVCAQIEIAGSLRRGNATVGDIEIVARPLVEERPVAGQLGLFGDGKPATVERVSLLDPLLERLAAAGEIHQARPFTHEKGAWGEKYKKFWTALDGGVIQVDLFLVTPPAQWGPIFTIRTGPGDFGQALMRHINANTLWRQDEGRLVHRGAGKEVQTPTERAYFEALGVPWIEPADRSPEALQKVLRQHGAL
jgi:DNA polymerase/3'-5' exonuclease PolX